MLYSTSYYKRRNDHLLANHADFDSSQIYLSIQIESLNVREFSSKSSVFSDKSTLQDFPSSRFRNVCTRPNDHGEYWTVLIDYKYYAGAEETLSYHTFFENPRWRDQSVIPSYISYSMVKFHIYILETLKPDLKKSSLKIVRFNRFRPNQTS